MTFTLLQRSFFAASILAVATHSGNAAAITVAEQTIVDWDLSSAPGNQASQPANSAIANVAGGSILRGSGLGLSSAAATFSGNGWEGAASGVTGDEYISFGFTVADGYTLDLGHLYVGTRSTASGPGTLGLFYSGDGYANSLFTFNQAATTGGTGNLYSAIDLSALTGLTGNVDFRIYEIGNTRADGAGATGGTGAFRLTAYFSGQPLVFDRNMQFTGTVAAVPEAETYAMLLAGLGLLGLRLRGRRGNLRRIGC